VARYLGVPPWTLDNHRFWFYAGLAALTAEAEAQSITNARAVEDAAGVELDRGIASGS